MLVFFMILAAYTFILGGFLQEHVRQQAFQLYASSTGRREAMAAYTQQSPLLGVSYEPQDSLSSLEGAAGEEAYASYTQGDVRVEAMRRFLRDYNSPMYPFAHVFVREADKYGLDWRLVASISGVESAFGLYVPKRPDLGYSYNAWGWAGNPDRSVRWSYFDGWSDGIATVTKGLALGYGTDLTPYEIVPSYCPDCVEGNGPWPDAVTAFMNELSAYEKELNAGN